MTDGRSGQDVRNVELELEGTVCLKIRPDQTLEGNLLTIAKMFVDQLIYNHAKGYGLKMGVIHITEWGNLEIRVKEVEKEPAEVRNLRSVAKVGR